MAGAGEMARVWATAVILLLAGIVAILNLPDGDIAESALRRTDRSIRDLDPVPDLLVIGTSLTNMAFPPRIRRERSEGSEGKTWQGLRIAMSCGQPDDLARLLDAAVARGIAQILIEINHFLYRVDGCHAETGVKAMLANFVTGLRWRIKWTLLGTDAALAAAEREPTTLGQIYDGDGSRLATEYSVTLRPSETIDLLTPALAAARQKGLDVILVVMPRSDTASRFAGGAFNTGLDARVAALRARVPNVVWEPARSWPDRYFADRAHMNLAGRERILAEMWPAIGNAR